MIDEVKLSLDGLYFTWDDNKAFANLKKHKVTFELAAEAFVDENAVFLPDEAHSDYEERSKVIGRIISKTLILSVIFVERIRYDNLDVYRIISARDADREEEEIYGMELSGGLPEKQRRSNSTGNVNKRRRH